MKFKTIGSSLALVGMIASSSLPVNAEGLTTIPEAMTSASIMEGYSFLLWGLQDLEGIDTNFEESFSFSFDETGVTDFNFLGMLNGNPLTLNYSGSLSGNFGSENMTWNGNWTGSYGNDTIQATDTATWFFDSGSDLYTSMTFQQDASLLPPSDIASSSLFGWLVVGSEVLGTVAAGIPTVGWGTVIAGAGLVLASTAALNPPTPTPPPTPPLPPVVPVPPLPPGSGYQEVWTYDGTTGSQTKTQTITPPANNNQLQTGGTINCNPTINVCNSSNVSIVVSTPESSNVLGILGMVGLGLFLSRHKIKN